VVEPIADTDAGAVDVADLRRRLAAGDVALVAVTHVPTHNGLINPAAQIGAACRSEGVPFLLDACQSAGQLPLDVNELGCDVLAATGRKWLRGPRGTGFLYVARSCRIEPPLIDLRAVEWPSPSSPDSYLVRADARRFELWEGSVAARLGLGAAVDYALGLGIPAIAARVQQLAATLRAALRSRRGYTVLDVGEQQCGIVTFTVEGVPPVDVVRQVTAQGININVASAATASYDSPGVRLEPVVRASPHYYNTEAELELLLAALPEARPR
jgi:cysteine desulfurase/selenocysteine lyase